ncbi:fumarylacetoacetate hydrolase family protein, partial [Bacillus thuringiensis]|nr:fumarylacetoacetate hydrolase family protein [Bacillus thuringiensis]
MKFVTFRLPSKEIRAGGLEGDKVIDLNLSSAGRIPSSMMAFLEKSVEYVEVVRNVKNQNKGIYALEEVQLTDALPNPSSIRDFYAFEQHV